MRTVSADVAAHAMGFSRTTLSAYETGASEPGLPNLCRMARYYGLSLDAMVLQDLRTATRFHIETQQRRNRVATAP